MASASNIEDLLQCPICLEMFDQPKVLDCQHTFCAGCLKIHQQQQRTASYVECPLCRRRSNLLNNSVDTLPGNYIVRDIIERQHGNRSSERSAHYQADVESRLKKLRESNDEKERAKAKEKEEEEPDYMQYVKPAAAALVGVLGGLLLAKGVQKLTEKEKK